MLSKRIEVFSNNDAIIMLNTGDNSGTVNW